MLGGEAASSRNCLANSATVGISRLAARAPAGSSPRWTRARISFARDRAFGSDLGRDLYLHSALRDLPATGARSILHNPGLPAGRHDSQPEASQIFIVIDVRPRPRLERIDRPFGKTSNCHLEPLQDLSPPCRHRREAKRKSTVTQSSAKPA